MFYIILKEAFIGDKCIVSMILFPLILMGLAYVLNSQSTLRALKPPPAQSVSELHSCSVRWLE